MAVLDIAFSSQSKMSTVKYKTAKQLKVQTEVSDIMSDIFLILITLSFSSLTYQKYHYLEFLETSMMLKCK